MATLKSYIGYFPEILGKKKEIFFLAFPRFVSLAFLLSSMASASTCPGLVAVVGDIMGYRDSGSSSFSG